MKATGIVRKIDDLGRVVIPKEIRRTMRIRTGDLLEIYTDKNGEVIFKKFSLLEDFPEIAANFAESVNKACGLAAIGTDANTVIAYAGISKTDAFKSPISEELAKIMDSQQLYVWQTDGKKITLTDSRNKNFIKTAMPIFSEGDVIGSVALIEPDDLADAPSEAEIIIVKTAAAFIGRHLEN